MQPHAPASLVFRAGARQTEQMRSKAKTHFVCQACGTSSAKWLGRCSGCEGWNTIVEEPMIKSVPAALAGAPMTVLPSGETARILTGISELDRVLGGGMVPGSVVLLGGEPGIGKSTLLLQALAQKEPTLYVTAEESAEQVGARARRLGLHTEHLRIVCSGALADVEAHLTAGKPRLVVVDSLQTMSAAELESSPGSVSQVREVAHRLAGLAKQHNTALFLVGQITKDGSLAGPKVVEHLVDVVLYFDTDAAGELRVLRAHKNRFGAVSEVGIFEMTESGLTPVLNPSERFLSERTADAPGSVVTAQLSGTRPLLAEVQALCVPTPFGMPRRTALGVDQNRLAMVLAVLERRADTSVLGCDVFVNAVGGLKLFEPCADLAIALAVASSFGNRSIGRDTIAFGELGLTGEIRKVARAEERVSEARRLGFARIIVPAGNQVRLEQRGDLVFVSSVAQALQVAL